MRQENQEAASSEQAISGDLGGDMYAYVEEVKKSIQSGWLIGQTPSVIAASPHTEGLTINAQRRRANENLLTSREILDLVLWLVSTWPRTTGLPAFLRRQARADLRWTCLLITAKVSAVCLFQKCQADGPGSAHARLRNDGCYAPGGWMAAANRLYKLLWRRWFCLPYSLHLA